MRPETLERGDFRRTLRFNTAEELQAAVKSYDAVDPVIPKDELQRISHELAKNGVWKFSSKGKDACSLEAERKNDGKYYLGIRDALGPGGSEKILAEEFGAALAYEFCSISRTWPSEGSRFAIPLSDIEAVYEALEVSFNLHNFSTALLKPKMREDAPDTIHHYTSPISFTVKDNISVTLELTPTRLIDPKRDDRLKIEGEERDYHYCVQDGYLSGPCMWAPKKSTYSPIGMLLTLRPVDGPTYDADLGKRICALGDKAEAVWLTPNMIAARERSIGFMQLLHAGLRTTP